MVLNLSFQGKFLAPASVKARVVVPLSLLLEAKPVKKWFHVLDENASDLKRINSINPLEDVDKN